VELNTDSQICVSRCNGAMSHACRVILYVVTVSLYIYCYVVIFVDFVSVTSGVSIVIA